MLQRILYLDYMTNRKPEFHPEEIENSNRIFKSATPKYTADWYIKWIASLMLMIAVCFRAADLNHMFDLYFSFMGTTGWLVVGFLWHDRALIFLNAILSAVLLTGIMKELLACSNCMIPL